MKGNRIAALFPMGWCAFNLIMSGRPHEYTAFHDTTQHLVIALAWFAAAASYAKDAP